MPLLANKTKRAPAFFIGHGSPINAIEENSFTKALKTLGTKIQRPKAILVISAHWSQSYNTVSLHDKDEDIMYDMFGFPDTLYEVTYPAPNAELLVPDIQELIEPLVIQERALDHGSWSVLRHLFPKADIPIMQLAINSRLTMQEHYEMGKKIRVLREHGIMLIGSGNITHNLQDISRQKYAPVFPWAKEFDNFVKDAIVQKNYNSLINFQTQQRYAQHAHPTYEHYIPLLYIAGSAYTDEKSKFMYEGFEHGSLSMRNWLLSDEFIN